VTAATTYRHPELGFELALPDGVAASDDVPGIALLLRPREDPEPPTFRPSLTVVAEELAGDSTLEGYAGASLRDQHRLLRSHHLLDVVTTSLGPRPAVRSLAHHNVDGEAVTIEQWRLLDGRLGYVLTASCATLDFGELGESLASTAESFRLP
jgi:hypothetical protein